MDTDRWILETIEFDRAGQVAKNYAETHPRTRVIVTADHECSGAAIIGATTVADAVLRGRAPTAAVQAVHTATDVFFKLGQTVVGGVR